MLVLPRGSSPGPCQSIPFGEVQWFILPPVPMANTCVFPPANTATGRPAGKFPPKISIAI